MFNKKLLLVLLTVVLFINLSCPHFSYTSNHINDTEYMTNNYTLPEEKEIRVINNFIPENYEKVCESELLDIYINRKTLQMKIKDKRTGYVWDGTKEYEQVENENLNKTYKNMMQSPIVIEYFDKKNKLRKADFFSSEGVIKEFSNTSKGVKAVISLKAIDIQLSVHIELDNDRVSVTVPSNEIIEGKEYKIATIQLYPFLGAVKENNIPGYIFIPDGCGALIRFQEKGNRYDSPYVGRIYGIDEGISKKSIQANKVEPYQVTIPVFGMIHGTRQNGFVSIVESGEYNADIVAYQSGVITDFYWTTTTFVLREQYFQPTSKTMGGINTYQKERNNNDLKINYILLANEDADYIGMAKKYREYLINKGYLYIDKDLIESNIPLRLEFLGSEETKWLFWKKAIKMTSLKEMNDIIDDIYSYGIKNIVTIYRGWNKGGLHSNQPEKFPLERNIGSKKDLKVVKENLKEKDIPLYFYIDYTYAYKTSSLFSTRKDAARKISGDLIEPVLHNLQKTAYYISPKQTLNISEKDMTKYREYGIDNLAIDKTSNILFSDYNKLAKSTRKEAATVYQKLVSNYKDNGKEIALYTPNQYMFKSLDNYFDIPLYSSRYLFETDTVPFLQIALHGYINYFAPFSNYSASKEEALRLVEYGANPSFYLTKEPSYKLKNTASKYLFTSMYDDWKDTIIDQYQFVNNGLKYVINATIEDRQVLDGGVVKVIYSNGISIIINYTDNDYIYNGQVISGKNYRVFGGE